MKLFSAKHTAPKYTDEGQGEPIVLLYGLFGSVKNFQPLIDHLRKTHRVIVPIFPFYELGFCVDIFTLMNFLKEVADELKLEKFHLLGNSMGGHIALLFTLQYPEKVKTLTLSGSSGLYEHGMGYTYPRRRDYEYIKTKTELTFYKPEVATKELVDEIYATVNSRKAIQIISLAKSTIRHNVEKDLHKLTLPCCLIWGKNDTITPPDVAESFHRLIPLSELHWIDECGHVPMLETPEAFNRLMDDFLLRCSADK